MADYTLLLRTGPQHLTSKTGDCQPVATITDIAQDWTRNTLWMAGCDVGTFTVYGDANQLASYWQSWLGMDLLETDQGVKTWNGQIQRVELYAGSMGVSRDLTLMYNKVRGQWNLSIQIFDFDIDEDKWTDWYTNTSSIRQYGTREEEVIAQSGLKADAISQVRFIMKMHAWPPRYACSQIRKPGETPMMKVYAAGYKHTLNNRYVDPTPDGLDWDNTTKVSDAITDVINGSDYVKRQSIRPNDHVLAEEMGSHVKGGDILDDFLEFTDTNQKLYHGYIDNNREFYYDLVDMNPKYYIRNGMIFADSGATVEIAPRHIRPGIARVMDFPVGGPDDTSIFNDRRDVLIEDISIDASGHATFKPKNSQISDYIALMASNLRYQRFLNFQEFMSNLSGTMGTDSGGGYDPTSGGSV